MNKILGMACLLLDIGIPLFFALIALVCIIRRPKIKRWEYLFLTSVFVFLLSILTNSFLLWIGSHFTYRLDLYAYRLDSIFGEPAFFFGKLMARHSCLDLVARSAYSIMFAMIMGVAAGHFFLSPLGEATRVVRTMLIAPFSLAISIAIPISGPLYSLRTFPEQVASLAPHPVNLTAPPNGFPSLHFTIALLLVHFTHGRIRLLTVPYAVLIFISTLGTGEHYFVDLLGAIPFTVLVIWLGGSSISADSATDITVNQTEHAAVND